MRVILVTSWFMSLNRPYLSPYLDEFVRRLESIGLEVSIYAPRPPKRNDFGGNVQTHRAITPLGFARFLVELLTAHDAIVHVQRPNTYASPFIVAARLLRKPVVVTIHRAEVLPYHPYPWAFLRRFVLRIIDDAICVSESTRELTIELGCPPSCSIVVYNTVNQQRFMPRSQETSRKSLGLALDLYILLFVGDLRREKGCDTLLRAFSTIPGHCGLLILGDGRTRGELEDLATSLSIREKVSFLGRIPHGSERLPLYYNASDVFVLPSLTEGHSMALLEALASGLPIVASRVGGNVETVEEHKTGILVGPKDVNELREALTELLSDTAARAKMGAVARESFLRKFGEKVQIAQTVGIYRSLITA